MTDEHRPTGSRHDPIYVVRARPNPPRGSYWALLAVALIGGGLITLGFAPVRGAVMLAIGAVIVVGLARSGRLG